MNAGSDYHFAQTGHFRMSKACNFTVGFVDDPPNKCILITLGFLNRVSSFVFLFASLSERNIF